MYVCWFVNLLKGCRWHLISFTVKGLLTEGWFNLESCSVNNPTLVRIWTVYYWFIILMELMEKGSQQLIQNKNPTLNKCI